MRIKEGRGKRGRATWFHIIACKACSAEWPSDPALQVVCGECQARPGERCSWRGPHGYTYHIGRDFQAIREGYFTTCDALTWDGRHSRHEVLVCDEPLPANLAAPLGTFQPVQLALL